MTLVSDFDNSTFDIRMEYMLSLVSQGGKKERITVAVGIDFICTTLGAFWSLAVAVMI